MTLSFSQQINGKPNYFIEKIWRSLPHLTILEHYYNYNLAHHDRFHIEFDKRFQNSPDGAGIDKEPIPINAKLHTIRRDEHNRWKEGMMIHPVVNNRTPERFQFAPEFKCTGVQEIEIFVRKEIRLYGVRVDGKELNDATCKELAVNDGFDGLETFLEYFGPDFKGKLIHWTDLRY